MAVTIIPSTNPTCDTMRATFSTPPPEYCIGLVIRLIAVLGHKQPEVAEQQPHNRRTEVYRANAQHKPCNCSRPLPRHGRRHVAKKVRKFGQAACRLPLHHACTPHHGAGRNADAEQLRFTDRAHLLPIYDSIIIHIPIFYLPTQTCPSEIREKQPRGLTPRNCFSKLYNYFITSK